MPMARRTMYFNMICLGGSDLPLTDRSGRLRQRRAGPEPRLRRKRFYALPFFTRVRTPRFKRRIHQSARRIALLGGANREVVGVLVLRVTVVAAHPAPLHVVRRRRAERAPP